MNSLAPSGMRGQSGRRGGWSFLLGAAVALTLFLAWQAFELVPRFNLIVLAFTGGFVLLILWEFPIAWAMCAAFILTGNITSFLPGVLSPLVLVGILSLSLKRLIAHDPIVTITPFMKWAFVFLAWYYLALLWSSSYDWFHLGGMYRNILLILLIALAVRTKKDMLFVILAAGIGVILTAVLAAYGIINFFRSGIATLPEMMSYDPSRTRFFGHWADPNIMAQTMVPFVGLSYVVFRTEVASWMRVLGALVIISGIAAVMISLSRGGMLSLGVLIVFILLAERRRWLWLSLGGLVVAGVMLLFPIDVFGRMETLGQGTGDASVHERLRLIIAGLNVFRENFLIGVGPGNFQTFSMDYVWTLKISAIAHNTYTEILSETGIIGALIFGFAIVAVYRELFAQRWRLEPADMKGNMAICMKATFYSTLVSCLFLSFATYPALWLAFTLMSMRNAIQFS